MLSALWDRPQATFASKLVLNGDTAAVTREVDAGMETIEVDLPAVISVDLRLRASATGQQELMEMRIEQGAEIGMR